MQGEMNECVYVFFLCKCRAQHFQSHSPLHSSIGLAKAALESMNRLNLFGDQGSSFSIIHVDPDAQYRNCVILNTLLPKESSSKESDASLLCITGYPAFSIDDPALCKRTEDRVKELCEVCVCVCGLAVELVTQNLCSQLLHIMDTLLANTLYQGGLLQLLEYISKVLEVNVMIK